MLSRTVMRDDPHSGQRDMRTSFPRVVAGNGNEVGSGRRPQVLRCHPTRLRRGRSRTSGGPLLAIEFRVQRRRPDGRRRGWCADRRRHVNPALPGLGRHAPRRRPGRRPGRKPRASWSSSRSPSCVGVRRRTSAATAIGARGGLALAVTAAWRLGENAIPTCVNNIHLPSDPTVW